LSTEQSPTTEKKTTAQAHPAPAFSFTANVYYWSIVALAGAAGVVSLALLRPDAHWGRAAMLTACAALAQLFVVRIPRNNQSYRTSIVFIAAAALLIEPGLVFLLATLHYIPAWVRQKPAWRFQVFNMANTTLAALAAWCGYHAVYDHVSLATTGRFTVAGAAACAAFVGVNHVVLAQMIKLTTGRSLLRTGLFSFESLSTDLVLAALGVGLTWFWDTNRWLVLFALAPLVIIHRAMYVPQLAEEAKVDAKTGLFNAKEFAGALHHELARAKRFDRPLALVMCDLDYLRNINNTHGHLAGDVVLTGIAEILRAEVREYDVAARFGGEEFSILLPETSADEAVEIAERVRRALESREFRVETVDGPIHATISLGVASFPQDAPDARELIHAADVAVYRAKAEGRNRTVRYTPAVELVELDERRRELHESPLGKSLLELEREPPRSAAG
jgi:diguanylate cyclase (GGDEF)-like protein